MYIFIRDPPTIIYMWKQSRPPNAKRRKLIIYMCAHAHEKAETFCHHFQKQLVFLSPQFDSLNQSCWNSFGPMGWTRHTDQSYISILLCYCQAAPHRLRACRVQGHPVHPACCLWVTPRPMGSARGQLIWLCVQMQPRGHIFDTLGPKWFLCFRRMVLIPFWQLHSIKVLYVGHKRLLSLLIILAFYFICICSIKGFL